MTLKILSQKSDVEHSGAMSHPYPNSKQLIHLFEGVTHHIGQTVGRFSIVMSRGNPWVQQAIPLPLPLKPPTPHQG